MMHRLQLVEEKDAEFTNVLGMALIVFEPAREAARSHQQLARGCIITMRLLARESVTRDFLLQPFANTDTRNRKCAQVKITAERHERDRGYGHDVSAIASHRVSLHAFANIAAQNVVQALAQ